MNGEIYIIKNDINDKVYIGQTTQGSEVRFKQHIKLLKSNEKQLIHKAIKKYGKEHFYFEILESDICIESLDDREEYWIAKYDSVDKGYNLCNGGHQTRKPVSSILIEKGQEIIDKYINQDISVRELEKQYGLSHGAISHFLKKHNINVSKRNKNTQNLTEDDKVKIANMYENGYSSKEISEEMNRNVATVRRYRQYKCCA